MNMHGIYPAAASRVQGTKTGYGKGKGSALAPSTFDDNPAAP
eukprot:CAMPEP_0179912030 /NCGR_PEP_ID=MMETSP0982-20121206/46690_1 /TAXON_ID=483367 /ORGANISM="non described non described, Strain CCMP 2436" /LENGTH=41 /DNA_ID= /DNA_START= /DNA_END= /DNA_ORIENTATION=